MRDSIIEKLQTVLMQDLFEETDVVYILSRIRKILEIDYKLKDFKKLKFYCDWSLHSRIEDTSAIFDELNNLPGTDLDSWQFVNYCLFDEEFKKFLSEYGLKTKIYDNPNHTLQFQQIMNQIFSDTPLILKTVKKKKIIFRERPYGHDYGLEFTISEE